MAEKGGKSKSNSKSPVPDADSTGGKARDSSKPTQKRGRKPSLKNLKTSENLNPSPEGDSHEGRESERPEKNVGKEKSGESKILPEVELKPKAELPKNVRVLMDCEAASILEGIQDHFQMLSDDLRIKIPDSFSNALRYTQFEAQQYSDSGDVAKFLQYPGHIYDTSEANDISTDLSCLYCINSLLEN
ncbi:uncharacterized protein LOC144703710 isoform X2 [Wolffia australiana]